MTAAPFAAPRRKRRWLRRILIGLGVILVVLLGVFTAFDGWITLARLRGPASPFDARQVPPAPDYAQAKAWLAFPGRNGLERSTPPGVAPVAEDHAPADVFFVHPTTFRGSSVWIAPYDASDEAAPLNPPVLLDQVSVFNGCCRLYAPHYRQATLAALKVPAAMDVAYGDIVSAFRYYITHLNNGRPLIIASHSQGTAHAIRLLQEEILDKPLKEHLVAAYLIGGYVPDTLGELGLPVCDDARQTGCVISYNTSQVGRSGARMIVDGKNYWWRGKLVTNGAPNAVCVNPLTWRRQVAAPASANTGSLPFPEAPFGGAAKPLPPLVRNLTGAACRDSLLEVDVPWSAPSGFIDKLSLVFGSYHLNDYGFFYDALRQNAIGRVDAWRTKQPPSKIAAAAAHGSNSE
ncbi:MAG: DUF3089 domain-containing protein [Candidatus Sphingomonas colombiensis]|nr:DUF3089 domain-containing protein [Sphingomonas sp.]WEK42486.1 MAG: DUF3089 domain-containing protein [Sphingomonas sp.]